MFILFTLINSVGAGVKPGPFLLTRLCRCKRVPFHLVEKPRFLVERIVPAARSIFLIRDGSSGLANNPILSDQWPTRCCVGSSSEPTTILEMLVLSGIVFAVQHIYGFSFH